MDPDAENFLKELYSDPSRPGSYGGINSLYRAVKLDGRYRVTRKQLQKWLRQNETYALHKPVKRKFPTARVIVGEADVEWDTDLADLKNLSRYNSGYKYFIVFIDDFSRYVFTKALKTKNSGEVTEAFRDILDTSGRVPWKIRSDKGKEYLNSQFQKLLKERGIDHILTQNETKASLAERVIQTLKGRIYKYFTEKETFHWTDILQNVTDAYNASYHRGIGTSPSSVDKEAEDGIWKRNFPTRFKERKPFDLEPDQVVRLSRLKRPFERFYDIKWTGELFRITNRFYQDDLAKYKVKDFLNRPIEGSFYREEVEPYDVGPNTEYKIEKVLRRRVRNGRREILVRWKLWPPEFDSWIPEGEARRFRPP